MDGLSCQTFAIVVKSRCGRKSGRRSKKCAMPRCPKMKLGAAAFVRASLGTIVRRRICDDPAIAVNTGLHRPARGAATGHSGVCTGRSWCCCGRRPASTHGRSGRRRSGSAGAGPTTAGGAWRAPLPGRKARADRLEPARSTAARTMRRPAAASCRAVARSARSSPSSQERRRSRCWASRRRWLVPASWPVLWPRPFSSWRRTWT